MVSVTSGVRHRKGGAKNVCLRFADNRVKILVAPSVPAADTWRENITVAMESNGGRGY